MHLWIGTSGFQYPEWKGGFYPAELARAKMLPFYAERFRSTESNYSFRTIPSANTIARWNAETPSRFKFSFKAPQSITHFAKLRGGAKTLRELQKAIAPLGEKLGAVLFQLPPTFKKDAPLLADFLAHLPAKMRAAFEFRHDSWLDDEVFGCLREHRAALCVAEDAERKTPALATAEFGYLRLRREDYSGRDLARWAKFVRSQAWAEAFVYFKHEETGVGPKFAQKFQKLIDA